MDQAKKQQSVDSHMDTTDRQQPWFAVKENDFTPPRIEMDSLGAKEVPAAAYYGVQSIRAQENFPLTGSRVHPQLIKAMGMVKLACTEANQATDSLEPRIAEAIKQACIEFIAGQYQQDMIVEAIQGGAGTSINMNVNEILANRAIEILGGKKGDYTLVSPNTHVNMAQSRSEEHTSELQSQG